MNVKCPRRQEEEAPFRGGEVWETLVVKNVDRS